MKHIAQQIVLVLAILALPFYQANARDIEHYFNAMIASGDLQLTGVNKFGASKNDGIKYVCKGAASFIYDGDLGLSLLNLPNQYDTVTISPPMNKLSEILIWRNPSAPKIKSVGVAYSRDSITWTDVPDDKMNYNSGPSVTVTLPVSAFYIRIYNPRSTGLKIQKITYTFLDCNCFTFMPE